MRTRHQAWTSEPLIFIPVLYNQLYSNWWICFEPLPFSCISSHPLSSVHCRSPHLGRFLLLRSLCFLCKPGSVSQRGKGSRQDFLVVQCLRIHLPMWGTQVPHLIQGDPTCHEATKPVHHSYWACPLELGGRSYWAHLLQLLKPERQS